MYVPCDENKIFTLAKEKLISFFEENSNLKLNDNEFNQIVTSNFHKLLEDL